MPAVLAIAAHPDDIEFLMAGTLLLLRERGWKVHCFNIARGNLGSMRHPPARIAAIRRREARAAAELIGAAWHPPVCDDLKIFYDDRLLRRVGAVVREVAPTIVLTHSPEDYMEDHMITSRLAVTAAFARAMPNFSTIPKRKATPQEITVYHAMPHGLCDGMRRSVLAETYVNTASVHATKRVALACHHSQKAWLDVTQGMDSYLVAMDEFSRKTGKLSQKFTYAEGWRRHSHLGFCREDADPLRDALRQDAVSRRVPS